MKNKITIAYAPGVCNINPAEIAYRRKAAIVGYVVAAVVFVLCAVLSVNVALRGVLTFLPLFVGAIGTLQVRNKFCVNYGASGKQNATDGSAAAMPVENADHRAADKRKARSMNLQAAGVSLLIVLLSLLLPRF